MKLDFSHVVSYSHRSEPLIPATLVIAREGSIPIGDYEVDILLLVDTGAAETLIEGVHIRAAGLDLFAGEPRCFHGFLGARATAYRHPVRLRVADLEFETSLAFSTQPLGRQVLGRDLMAGMLIGLRERAHEVYFAPDPA